MNPPGTDPAPRRVRALELGLLALLVAVFHGPSLSFGFVYDDRWTLLDNPIVRDAGNLLHLLGPAFARAGVPDAGRPLMLASEMLDWALAGPRPFVFHLQNLLWHAGVACLALVTFCRWGVARPVAWLGAAIFAVHPLNVEPVAVINYREDLLAAFFVLLALRLAAGGDRLAAAGAGLATLLGVLAKENGALTPLLFLALVSFASAANAGPALRARLPMLAALVVPVGLGFSWRWWIFGAPGVVSATAEIPAAHESLLYVLPRAALAFGSGLLQFVWPGRASPEYPDAPADLVAVGWGLLVAGVALSALLLAFRRRTPAVALGGGWALLAYLPHLGLVPLTNLRADRYFYLPSLGLALLAAALLVAAWERLGPAASGPGDTRRPAPAALALAAVLLVALGMRSVRQARVWRDDLAVFGAAAAADPGSQRALLGLAAARLRAGQSLAALEAANAALALGEAPRAREMRGIVLLTQGDAPGAVRDLDRALATATAAHRPQVLLNRGLARARAGDVAGARADLTEAVRRAPLFERPALALARLFRDQGQPGEAVAVLEALRARVVLSAEGEALLTEVKRDTGAP